MAAKSFLKAADLKKAESFLSPLSEPPDGDEKSGLSFPCEAFSSWLGLRLEKLISQDENWQKAAPVALGSWARGELCPRSDFDLLFCGDEEAVAPLVDRLQKEGLRIRYRVPQNDEDWLEGVEELDALALMHAKPFTAHSAEKLFEQQKKIEAQGRVLSRRLLKAMAVERKKRQQRYDSISNFLEPNLKYGAGGLRDLQQALYIYELFADKFVQDRHAKDVLSYYKRFFLTIRQKLHLSGSGDILTAHDQKELSEWFGYSDRLEFMREVQKGLSRVSFYADWVVEKAQSGVKKLSRVEERRLKTVEDVFSALAEDKSLLMQYRVRRRGPLIKANEKTIGRALKKYIHPDMKEEFWIALFRSRWIDACIKELRPLNGLVQHDQYHRYSAETHVLQCLRTLSKMYFRPKSFGNFQKLLKRLDESDWQVLLWSCFYHDIGKGRRGDHSKVGARIVEKDMEAFGLSKKLSKDLRWMVENHLILSRAAFRKNPLSPKTWQELNDLGVSGRSLLRLAVFTAIDIQATNPESWNQWKQRLILELVETLESPSAGDFIRFLKKVKEKKLKYSNDELERFSTLATQIPTSVFINDLSQLQSAKRNLPPLIIGQGSEKWIRFHERKDRSGLFVEFVTKLFASGVSIRQASAQTFKYGVYDWFFVKTNRSTKQLSKLLSNQSLVPRKRKVLFSEISLVSSSSDELVISFKGRDRSGALASAAEALFSEGLEILWATAHTWGRNLDDVFGVRPPKDPEATIRALREKSLIEQ